MVGKKVAVKKIFCHISFVFFLHICIPSADIGNVRPRDRGAELSAAAFTVYIYRPLVAIHVNIHIKQHWGKKMSNVQTKQLYFRFGITNKPWHRLFMYEIQKKRQKKSLLKCCIQMQIQKTWDELRRAPADIQSAAFQLWIKRLFCIWWLFLLPWSTEAKQYLLVVSLGMFLEKEQKQQVRHAAWQNKLYCKSLIDQRQVRKFTCHNSLLQRLPKAGLVFRADFSQVHLTAWHNNSGHHLLFGPFTLRKRAQVST